MTAVSVPHRVEKFVGLVAACGLLSLALLPAEHVHVVHEHDGHHSEMVHRHFAPHDGAGSRSLADDDDSDVHWLSSWFTSPQRPQHGVVLQQLSSGPQNLVPLKATGERTVRIDDVSVHDPPSTAPLALRAPPTCL